MLFVDTKPSWRSITLLVLLSLAILAVNIALPQLRKSDEALNGAYTQGMTGCFLQKGTVLYGQQVNGYPLYPWLAHLCSAGGIPTPVSMRLPAMLSLLGLALITGIFALKIQSSFAGIMSACVVLLSVVSLKIGTLANVDIVVSFLITSAWYALYLYGWSKRMWWQAWGIALSLVLLGTFGWGLKAFLLFYVPLFFLWNRLDGFDTLQSPQHIITAAAAIILLIIKGVVMPTIPLFPWKALAFVNPPETFSGYITHLFTMLPKTACYLFPWTLISWAPFCLALRQFESHRTACHYLRVIVASIFVLYMLMPGGSPLHLLPVFGPFAVLIGVHAEIVLRRHRDFLAWLLRFSAWLCFCVALAGCILWGIVLLDFIRISFVDIQRQYLALGCSAASLLSVSACILFNGGRHSFRTCIIWVIFGYAMLYTSIAKIPSSSISCSQKHSAELLQVPLPVNTEEDAIVPETLSKAMNNDGTDVLYLATPQLLDAGAYLVELFYLKTKLIYIKDMQTELPATSKVVYVLSPHIPAVQEREWKAFSSNVRTGERDRLIMDFNGLASLKNLVFPVFHFQTERASVNKLFPELRIYRGTLKTPGKN